MTEKKRRTLQDNVGIILIIGAVVSSILLAILNMTVNLTDVSPRIYSINAFFRDWGMIIFSSLMLGGILCTYFARKGKG